MKNPSIFVLFLFALTIACSGKKYVTVPEGIFDDFDLAEYQTFDFFETTGPEEPGTNFNQNVQFLQKTITEKMEERGLRRERSNPDLKINLGMTVQDKVQTRETNLATDPFMYTGQRNYTWSVREVPVNTYKEGSLTMHLVDNKSNEAVWIGTIDRALPNKEKNLPATIQDAVDLLFAKIDN
ncbi:DUF4136 domain-containing protein [Algoriphagus sp. NF]|jgi:hypothetical protein|uniref:DUF4136 domain-containing protein n=1 Tax=Algoriphagus sp. NF TaxID=2992756 RepID=UPI001065066F|nr:DUF4136 domain-containing protein [Algoriphagus sp. NF]MDE0562005.1 DUF4136 domain-containing protein [Algoriphagus sp. NF]